MLKSTIQFYSQRGKRTVDETERRLEDSIINLVLFPRAFNFNRNLLILTTPTLECHLFPLEIGQNVLFIRHDSNSN